MASHHPYDRTSIHIVFPDRIPRGGGKKKSGGSRGKKDKKSKSRSMNGGRKKVNNLNPTLTNLWKMKWNYWGDLVRARIRKWREEVNEEMKEAMKPKKVKMREVEMPEKFRMMGTFCKENCDAWEGKGVQLLGIDPEEFGVVSIAKSWRESTQVMMWPSSEAMKNFEELFKWIIKGTTHKLENKLKDIL